ncbi:TonB-dependent receptor [Desulfothermus naphthae]
MNFLFYPVAGIAQEKKKGFELKEIIVTATRHKTPVEHVPASVTIITRDQIKASSGMRLDDILRRCAGIDIRRPSGFLSHSATVSMRGMGDMPGRTLVLLDGIPMNKADTGSVNWDLFGMEDIERVEIVRGPASALYGSSAMGGVINIITRRPEHKPIRLDVRGSYGNWDTWNAGTTVSGTFNKFGYYLSYDHLDSNGYNPTPSEERTPYDIKRYLEEDHFWTKFTYKLTDTSSVSIGYLHFEDERGEGEKYRHPDGVYRSWDTDSGNLAFKFLLGRSEWLIRGFYNEEDYFWNRERFRRGRYTWYKVDVERIDSGATIQTTFPIINWIILTSGFDYKYGSVDGKDGYILERNRPSNKKVLNEGKQYSLSPFINTDLQVSRHLSCSLGLRYDYVKSYDGSFYDSSGFLKSQDYDSKTWDEISPKVALLYRINSSTSLRASVGKAFRAPILDDLYRSGIFRGRIYTPNPKLGPEKLITYELGIKHYFTKNLSVELSGYYTDADDFFYPIRIGIDPNTGRDLYQRQNVGEVDIYGIEFQTDFRINSYLSSFGNVTWNESEIDEFDPNPDLEKNELEYTPNVKANIGLLFSHPKICQAQIVGRYVGEMYSNPENTEELDDHFVVDLKISRKFYNHVTLYLNIMNLFDEDYEEYPDSEAPGFFVMGGIRLKF